MARNMINPAQYIAFVDTLNELEQKAKKIKRYGLPITVGEELSKEFEHYSVEWDGASDRWTLLSETDNAPDLCPFNQVTAECSETDLCEQCWQVAQTLADENDDRTASEG